MKSKGITLLIVLAIMISIASCKPAEQPNGGTDIGVSREGRLFEEPVDISIMVKSHSSWPFDENWPVWRYIKEATGANIIFSVTPNMEYLTKLTLMIAAPDTMTDLASSGSKLVSSDFANQGAIIAIDDYPDIIPNYTKFWNSLPKEERERKLMWNKAADGKIYLMPTYGTDSRQGVRAWLYRKDIFEKHNFKVPENMDEVYEVAKELKKLYPDSYPLCMREGLRNIDIIGPQWKPNFAYAIYYDFENNKWSYGATEPVMREIVEYFIKMRSEGLIPPDYLNINTKTWEELVSMDKGFIMPDYAVRIDFFNIPNREQNPDYTLATMIPPRANSETGQNLISKRNVDMNGIIILNTGVDTRIKNAIKFIDWMYSDEAAELVSWGKEGETYEVVDGEKRYIRAGDEDIQSKYGFFTYCAYLRTDPDSALAVVSDEQAESTVFALEYTEKDYNPTNWLSFKPEDDTRRAELHDTLHMYVSEMLSKFLIDREPMSKWDEFVNKLYELDVDELISFHEKAYSELN